MLEFLTLIVGFLKKKFEFLFFFLNFKVVFLKGNCFFESLKKKKKENGRKK